MEGLATTTIDDVYDVLANTSEKDIPVLYVWKEVKEKYPTPEPTLSPISATTTTKSSSTTRTSGTSQVEVPISTQVYRLVAYEKGGNDNCNNDDNDNNDGPKRKDNKINKSKTMNIRQWRKKRRSTFKYLSTAPIMTSIAFPIRLGNRTTRQFGI